MVSVRYANAMAEVLYYLKGIREEDVEKIPKKFMEFLKENASKDYVCQFDYNKPLKEQNLLEETRGIIGTICLNYWCQTDEQKQRLLNKMKENEVKYQKELREKYNPDNLFKNTKKHEENVVHADNMEMIEYKQSFFQKIINKLKIIFKKDKFD